MLYVDYVYDIVRLDCEGMDAIYKDYIIQMVGRLPAIPYGTRG